MSSGRLNYYQERIIPILAKYRVRKAAFFGSLVEGKMRKGSDIDILVEPPKSMSLLGFVGLKQDIEDHVRKDIDLVSYNGLSPYLKKHILSQQQVFYEAE